MTVVMDAFFILLQVGTSWQLVQRLENGGKTGYHRWMIKHARSTPAPFKSVWRRETIRNTYVNRLLMTGTVVKRRIELLGR